jgi:hypothetical protein
VTGLPQPSWRVGSSRQGDAGAQLVDDAGKRRAVVDAGAAAVAAWWDGQQRLDGLPELLGTRVSIVVVMSADPAREQGEQQEPAEGRNTL